MTIGTRVAWKSQSHAYTKTKRGVIVAVVPEEASAYDVLPRGMRCAYWDGYGNARMHRSYLVEVDGKPGLAWWPRVSQLKVEGTNP